MFAHIVLLTAFGRGDFHCEAAQRDVLWKLNDQCDHLKRTLSNIEYRDCTDGSAICEIDDIAQKELPVRGPNCSGPNLRECCEINCGDD